MHDLGPGARQVPVNTAAQRERAQALKLGGWVWERAKIETRFTGEQALADDGQGRDRRTERTVVVDTQKRDTPSRPP